MTAAGWILFAIIFFWQPPHVWAIALFRKADYAAAGIPMLPNVIGDEPTRWRDALVHPRADSRHAGARGPRPAGPGVPFAPLALDAWFTWHIVRVLRERTEEAARRAFHVSLVYLFALFLAMLVDVVAR